MNARSGAQPPARQPFEQAAFAAPRNKVDEAVFGRLARLHLSPARPASDAVFLRRVYLDAIGTLPTAEEARAFLDDASPTKRSALIDRLLERDEFADYWAMKWGDVLRVKSEFPINLWPNAVQAYHRVDPRRPARQHAVRPLRAGRCSRRAAATSAWGR